MYLALISIILARFLEAAHLRAPCPSANVANEVLPAVDIGVVESIDGIPLDHLNYVSPKRNYQDGGDDSFPRTYQPSGAIVSPNFEVSAIGADRLPVPNHASDHDLSPPNRNTPLHAPRPPIIEVMYPNDRRALPIPPERLTRLMTKLLWGEPTHEFYSNADQRLNSQYDTDTISKDFPSEGGTSLDNNLGLLLHGDMTIHNDLTTRDYRDSADAESLKSNEAVLPSLSYMPPSPISEDDWDPRPMKPLIKLRKNMLQADNGAESISSSTPTPNFSEALADYELAQRKRWNCLLLIDGILFSLILAVLLRQR